MHILVTSIIDLEKTSYSRLHHFIDYLLRKGHKITVLSIKDNWKHKGIKQNSELVKKIKIIHISNKGSLIKQKIDAVVNIKKLIKKINLDDVDVHLSYNSMVLSYFIIKELNKKGVKTVYDLADDLPEMVATSPQIPFFLRGIAKAASRFFLYKDLSMSSIVTITAKEFESSMGIKKYNHVLLPNGVDIAKFSKTKKKEKGFVVGYLGALREWVDLRDMIRAAYELSKDSHYRKIKVLVVGGEEDLPRYKKFVKENNISIVEFTGNVPYNKVKDYINKMDIATIPFKKNRVTDGTCPLKMLEYMACEKPVIATRLNEIRNMAGDNVLYADGIEEWKKQISLLYNDPVLRERMGKKGREIAKSYDWAKICRKMEKILYENSKLKHKETKSREKDHKKSK